MKLTASASSKRNPWLAKINGKDKQYGFARSFVRSEEYKEFGERNCRWTIEDPGIYEIGGTKEHDGDSRPGFILFYVRPSTGELTLHRISKDRALSILTLIDSGKEFDEARKETNPNNSAMVTK